MPGPLDRDEKGEAPVLSVQDGLVTGEVAIALPSWSKAPARHRALDARLAGPFHEICTKLGLVLAAAPSSYASPRPGKAAPGTLVYDVRGLIEGDRIVPARRGPHDKK
jgi:hypothetical protein